MKKKRNRMKDTKRKTANAEKERKRKENRYIEDDQKGRQREPPSFLLPSQDSIQSLFFSLSSL